MARDKGMKLGVYTNEHGFMTVEAFNCACGFGGYYPVLVGAPLKRTMPVSVSAPKYRRIMAGNTALAQRMEAKVGSLS